MTPRFNWLASYPKSGNTWVRLFLSHLNTATEKAIDLNQIPMKAESNSRIMFDRTFGFDTGDLTLEECIRLRPIAYRWMNAQLTHPIYIKAHDACDQLTDGDWLMAPDVTDKTVYILRNPLDVAISLAHFQNITIDKSITFLGDADARLARYTPTRQHLQLEQRLGTWSEHVLSWADNPNFNTFVLRYEDLLNAPKESFSALCEFLGLEFDGNHLDQSINSTSFKALQSQEKRKGFRERPQKAKHFFRSGKFGQWKTTLSTHQIDTVLSDHLPVMQKFGYANDDGTPRFF